MRKFKLIETYPDSPGLGFVGEFTTDCAELIYKSTENLTWSITLEECLAYPKLWKELLPEYIKCVKPIGYCSVGHIYKTEPYKDSYRWLYEAHNTIQPANSISLIGIWDYAGLPLTEFVEPATEEEYTNMYFPMPKTYEILEYEYIAHAAVATLRPNGTFYAKGFGDENIVGASLDEVLTWLKREKVRITKIKRLSDNCIFTIGDTVTTGVIETITLDDSYLDGVKFTTGQGRKLALRAITLRPVVFTTKDGVAMHYRDACVVVLNDFTWNAFTVTKDAPNPNLVYFSYLELAEEYIELHKPMYSKQDILDMFVKIGNSKNVANMYLESLEHK